MSNTYFVGNASLPVETLIHHETDKINQIMKIAWHVLIGYRGIVDAIQLVMLKVVSEMVCMMEFHGERSVVNRRVVTCHITSITVKKNCVGD